MSTGEADNKNKASRVEEGKNWLYIICFMMFFLLLGTCVKWISAAFHGPH